MLLLTDLACSEGYPTGTADSHIKLPAGIGYEGVYDTGEMNVTGCSDLAKRISGCDDVRVELSASMTPARCQERKLA